jgi:hypothetical protein
VYVVVHTPQVYEYDIDEQDEYERGKVPEHERERPLLEAACLNAHDGLMSRCSMLCAARHSTTRLFPSHKQGEMPQQYCICAQC